MLPYGLGRFVRLCFHLYSPNIRLRKDTFSQQHFKKISQTLHMQQINKITQPSQRYCCFVILESLGQTQQILHLKLPWISNYMQKINIILQTVSDILKFKKSCNMICEEHFGLYLEKQIFPRHAVFTKSYRELWGII